VQVLAGLGHRVETGGLPLDLGFITEAWPQIGQIGLARMFEEHPDWEAQASPKYREMAEAGRRLPAQRLWQFIEAARALRRDSAALFETLDVIVMPAAAALPWPAHEAYPRVIDGHEVGPRGHAVYTGWVNAAGLPAVAMPCEPAAEGLPIGAQFIGRFGSDSALLDFAEAFENAAPQHARWPPL
jgi:aspartyl-tRNA(Asn)/glutamyl-tRNA(Gln) amidotransferase subunit A